MFCGSFLIFSTTDRGNDRIGVWCVYSYESALGVALFDKVPPLHQSVYSPDPLY